MIDSDRQNNKKSWWQPGLVLFGKLSGWIVGPIIIALVVGKFLDRKFATEPWLFLGTVLVSFVFSMIGIVVEGIKAMKIIDQTTKGSKQEKKDKDIEK